MAADAYAALRGQLLSLDPASVGLGPGTAARVWGVLFELGYPEGTATVVALADGTTSLYTSGGGGVIGAGEHEPVAAATRALLAVVETHLAELGPDGSDDLPADGHVTVRALTYDGRLVATAAEEELGERRHPLWPVFYAGHDVITAVRTTA